MTSISSNGGGGFGSSSSSSSGGVARPMTGGGGQDPNGMERLVGESDEQYIARQTRLRDEAKARMAAKFGGGGGGGTTMMGGVGSNGGGGGSSSSSRMGGIGSDPNYNPNGGGYGASDFDVGALSSTVMSGLGSAFGALSTVANTVTAAVADESTKRSVVETAGSFWGGLSKGASTLINTVTQPDGFDPGSDGLEDLQRQFHSQRSTQPSKYGGFGSDSMFAGSRPTTTTTNMMGGSSSSSMASTAVPSFASTASNMQSTLGEALPGPGEDPNGIERLSGESDEQYVMRQTRLRDEAKARMAAKFGGGASRMGGVGSSSGGGGGMGSSSSSSGGGWGGGGGSSSSAPSSGGFGGMKPTPPSSGNFSPPRPTPPKPKVASGEDFFANFGT